MAIACDQVPCVPFKRASQNHIIVWVFFDDLKLNNIIRHYRCLSYVCNPLVHLCRALPVLFPQASAIRHFLCLIEQSRRDN